MINVRNVPNEKTILSNLPQRDQKRLVEYRLNTTCIGYKIPGIHRLNIELILRKAEI